jgi:hypothetical protein
MFTTEALLQDEPPNVGTERPRSRVLSAWLSFSGFRIFEG